MDKGELRYLNELEDKINNCNRSYNDICESRREIELNEFSSLNDFIYVTIDRRKCEVRRDRLISFLNKEAEVVKNELTELELEFKNK